MSNAFGNDRIKNCRESNKELLKAVKENDEIFYLSSNELDEKVDNIVLSLLEKKSEIYCSPNEKIIEKITSEC